MVWGKAFKEALGVSQINSGGKNMSINRRSFIQTAAAVTASLSAPMVMANGGKPRVVVIGGGAGGATAARYIAKDSKGAIDVTLVEPSRTYYT